MNNQKSELEIDCPIHEIPYAGLCSDQTCKNNGLICLKCNMEPCSVSKNHELISIDEFYSRYFTKTPVIYNFEKFSDTIKRLNKVDKNLLGSKMENFNKLANDMIENKLNIFYKNSLSRIDKFKNNILEKLDILQKDYLTAENRIDLSSFETPENFTLTETKKFFEKNQKSIRDMENMINLIKKYSDNEKLTLNQKDMESIIYSKNLADTNPNEIISSELKKINTNIKESLKAIQSNILSANEKTVLVNITLNKFKNNPLDLVFYKDITDKCQKSYTIDSVFTAFNTIDNKQYVAWGSSTYVIEIYDLSNLNHVKTLTGHTQHIYIVRHFRCTIKNIDYLLSTSYERNCKIWDVKTFNCIVTVSSCHSGYYLYSALIVFDNPNNKSYIVTSAPNEFTKVWDFNANHVKDIATTTDYTYFINTWYYKDNIYIINANSTDVKIYDFKSGALYKTFKSDGTSWHMSAFISDIKEVPHLFETDGNGYLRIWNIETGVIYKNIHASGCNLRGILLWNDEYVIAASSDKSFKIFNINTSACSTISGHENVLCTVEKISINGLGECLLTSAIDGKIKIWKKA